MDDSFQPSPSPLAVSAPAPLPTSTTTRIRANFIKKTVLYRALFPDEAYKKNGVAPAQSVKRAIDKMTEYPEARQAVKDSLRPSIVLVLLQKVPKTVIPPQFYKRKDVVDAVSEETNHETTFGSADINYEFEQDEIGKRLLDSAAAGLQNPINLSYWQSILDLKLAFSTNQSSSAASSEQNRSRSARARRAKRDLVQWRSAAYRTSMKRAKIVIAEIIYQRTSEGGLLIGIAEMPAGQLKKPHMRPLQLLCRLLL